MMDQIISWILSPLLGFLAGVVSQGTKFWLRPLGARYSAWRKRIRVETLRWEVLLVLILFPLDMLVFLLAQIPILAIMFVSASVITGNELRALTRGKHVWVLDDIFRAVLWLVFLFIGVVLVARYQVTKEGEEAEIEDE
jgi:hypothetical protein